MSSGPNGPADDPRAADAGEQLSEEQLRAAYEEELSRLTTSDLALQAAVSLLNLGGRRLGLSGEAGQPLEGERDLEQVRDAIDSVSGLLEVLERRRPSELRPLRDALAQLQMAYAREASAAHASKQTASAEQPEAQGGAAREGSGEPASGAQPDGGGDAARQPDGSPAPGPAESSGRLWVPGR